jgi:predicted amidohydrolase YtcJ
VPQRHLRIEHGDSLLPDLASRAGPLGAIAVQNPTRFQTGDVLIQRFGADRAAVNSPLRSLVAAA